MTGRLEAAYIMLVVRNGLKKFEQQLTEKQKEELHKCLNDSIQTAFHATNMTFESVDAKKFVKKYMNIADSRISELLPPFDLLDIYKKIGEED